MQVLHIIAGLPVGGGLTESVPSLCVAEQRQGVEVALATTQENCLNASLPYCLIENHVRVLAFGRSWPRAVYFSWGMLMGLGKEVRAADVVHIHSNWTFPVWWGGWLALRYKKTLVMSPRGCLDPVRLQHSAWKKRLVGWMDRWLLRRASVVHATCEGENAWVQAFLGKVAVGSSSRQWEEGKNIEHSTLNIQRPTGKMPKIVVIPNGVGE